MNTTTSAGRKPRDKRQAEQAYAAEQRRVTVAALLLRKLTYREIAVELGVGKSTVERDVAEIRAAWRARAGVHYDDLVAEEVAKLDVIERELWRGLALGTEKGGIDAGIFARAYVRVMERRARLQGLDVPFKIEQRLDEDATALMIVKALEGALDELGVSRKSKNVGAVVSRHLSLVADEAEGRGA